MVTQWRWDQGRLDYFSFSNIALIANVLSEGPRYEMSSPFVQQLS